MLRSIGKQSGQNPLSQSWRRKRKAMVGRICRKGRFTPGTREWIGRVEWTKWKQRQPRIFLGWYHSVCQSCGTFPVEIWVHVSLQGLVHCPSTHDTASLSQQELPAKHATGINAMPHSRILLHLLENDCQPVQSSVQNQTKEKVMEEEKTNKLLPHSWRDDMPRWWQFNKWRIYVRLWTGPQFAHG